MKILLITLCLVVLPFSISKAEWTQTNTIMELSWITLHIADWTQTIQIAKNPDRYHERNPILGRHPSVRSVNRFMVIGLVAHTSISILLPKDKRDFWQITSIAVAGIVVGNNFRIGLTF